MKALLVLLLPLLVLSASVPEPVLSYAAAMSALTLEPIAQGPGGGPLATCGCTPYPGGSARASGGPIMGCAMSISISMSSNSPGLCHKIVADQPCNHLEEPCVFVVLIDGVIPAGWRVYGATSTSADPASADWQPVGSTHNSCGPFQEFYQPAVPCGGTRFIFCSIAPPAGSPALGLTVSSVAVCASCGT